MATQQEVIKSVMNSLSLTTLTGTNALDEAIRTGTNYKFSSLDDSRTKFLNDIRTVNDADEFLKDYCGIILGNSDTGAITGSDAGNGLVKTKESVVLETTGVDDWDYVAPGSTVTLSSGLKVNMPSTREDGSALTANDLFILKGLPHWLEAGIDLNKESYGIDFSGTAVNTFNVSLYSDQNDNALASAPTTISSSTGKAYVAGVKINTYHYSNLDTTDENGKDLSSGQEYLDRTIAHELNHAILAANIKNVSVMHSYITEGTAELVHGVDDTRPAISVLAGDANLMDQALYSSANWAKYPTVYSGSTRLNAPAYAGGYTFWRYMARQTGDLTVENKTDTKVKTFLGNDNIKNFVPKADINSGAGNDYIAVGSDSNNVTIDGGAGNDFINNWGSSAKVTTGAGADTVHNSSLASNSYISSGADNDSIKNYANNVTADGGAGNDSLFNGSYDETIKGGNNVSLNGGANNDYLYNMQGNKITLIGGANDDQAHSYQGETVTADLGAGNDYFNAYQSKNVTAHGGAGTDTLQAINGENFYADGGAGNDSIFSSAKNSTLIGGANNDTINLSGGYKLIIYNDGDGNDSIRGFNSTSTLQIGNGTGTYSKATNNDDLIFTVGSGLITLAGAANLSAVNIFGKESNSNALVLTDSDSYKQTLKSGVEVGDATARTKATYLVGNALANSMVGGAGSDSIYGKDGNDYLEGGASNDYLNGQAGNDTLWGGSGNDTFKGDAGADLFLYTAGNDVIADFTAYDTLRLGNGTATYSKTTAGSNLVLTVGSGKVTLTGAASLSNPKILGKESNSDSLVLTDGDSYKQTLASGVKTGNASSRTAAIYLVGNALANTLIGGSGKDSLYGKDGADYLAGKDGNDYLNGQAGNDTLSGGAGNDTLKGDAGADLFLYTAGNDVIADFTTYDTLQLGNGTATYSKATAGSNLVLTVGSGKVTLTGAATLSNPKILGKLATNDLTLTDSAASKQTLKSGVEVGDASARTAAIYMVGNALDNTLYGGSGNDTLYGKDGEDYLVGYEGNDYLNGQNGDDMLWGGAGNDTLKGGDGDDTFIYSPNEGKDTITDYESGELVAILDGDSYGTFKNSIFASNKLTLTIDGGGSLVFNNVTSSTMFNINANAYYISGSKLVK